MSSDRRSRPGTPPRRRADDVYDDAPESRRDPRRRTDYVPRQEPSAPRRTTSRPAAPADDRRRAPARQRPQQPPYRTRQPEPDLLYGDEELNGFDYYDADDQVIEDEPLYEPAPRQRRPSRGGEREPRQRAPRDAYADSYEAPRTRGGQLYDEYEYDEGYEDSFIDEEDWYEEEAAAGAYSPRRARAPRQARSLPRPAISMPKRPNIPRPVMPSRVKEAALVQDQPALILFGTLLLSAVAMALLTMNRVDSLAPGFATHISASGIREAFRSETALWQLPLMAGALLLMNAVLAWVLAQYSRFSARFVLGTSIIVHVLLWVAFFRIAF